MSESEPVNLIDLSFETETQKCSTLNNIVPERKLSNECDPIHDLLLSPLKNNALNKNSPNEPSVGCRGDDPFDILEKEAFFKASQATNEGNIAKLEKLLSLSDDQVTVNGVKATLNFTPTAVLNNYCSPIGINDRMSEHSNSCPSSENCNVEISASSKLKKSSESRKNLLKLSLTNSTIGSPVTKLSSLENTPSTPLSSMFPKDIDFSEPLLASESPLKFVDDDEGIYEGSAKLIDVDKNFDADLEMLKIPMLDELSSPKQANLNSLKLQTKNNVESGLSGETVLAVQALPNLEAIKAKLEAKREKTIIDDQQQDICALIENLQSLVTDHNIVDHQKMQKVTQLLENLSSTLRQSPSKGVKNIAEKLIEADVEKNLDKDVPLRMDELPQCMVSSTATYDGDNEPYDDLKRPEIITPPIEDSCYQNTNETKQPDINDIVDNLTKLLTNSEELSNRSALIVVMNTPSPSTKTPADLKTEVEKSPTLYEENAVRRRRSQSLSLHDKIQIVHLPLTNLCTSRPNQKQKDNNIPTPVTPIEDIAPTKCRTSGTLLRRNSYSGISLKKSDPSIMANAHHKDLRPSQHEQRESVIKPMRMPMLRPDPKKKIKSNAESIMKSSGPLKATIPMKKIVPTLKTSPVTPNQLTKKNIQQKQCNESSSKMSTLTVPSTPMPMGRAFSVSVVGNPRACSTPSDIFSPIKRSGSPCKKSTYSKASSPATTRNSLAPSTSLTALKRRTISDFKVKSPLKTKSTATEAGIRMATCKPRASIISSVKAATGSSINNKSSTSTNNLLASRKSPRLSVGNSRFASKNKENKRP